mmetsp:Transcript_49975/g.97802  ORF Transcript_49975/g.97802 Transcript_49975/m.97802 type:complete len:206 (+) Transcript_49975:914-1531(+)
MRRLRPTVAGRGPKSSSRRSRVATIKRERRRSFNLDGRCLLPSEIEETPATVPMVADRTLSKRPLCSAAREGGRRGVRTDVKSEVLLNISSSKAAENSFSSSLPESSAATSSGDMAAKWLRASSHSFLVFLTDMGGECRRRSASARRILAPCLRRCLAVGGRGDPLLRPARVRIDPIKRGGGRGERAAHRPVRKESSSDILPPVK